MPGRVFGFPVRLAWELGLGVAQLYWDTGTARKAKRWAGSVRPSQPAQLYVIAVKALVKSRRNRSTPPAPPPPPPPQHRTPPQAHPTTPHSNPNLWSKLHLSWTEAKTGPSSQKLAKLTTQRALQLTPNARRWLTSQAKDTTRVLAVNIFSFERLTAIT